MIVSPVEMLEAIVLVSVLAYLAVKFGTIDWPGAITGEIISLITFVAGAVSWLVTIVAFFLVSSAFTRYRYDYKRKLGSAQEKGGRRSWQNTLANGGVAAGASIAEIFTHSNVFAIAFITSVAAALSDTLATEIGLLSKSRPRLITNLKRIVPAGTSGGITGLGEAVAVISSSGLAIFGIGIMAVQADRLQLVASAFVSIVSGAVIGTTFDSFLGSSYQALYRCSVCGGMTENSTHHGQRSVLIKGKRILNNNSVNVIGILVGAVGSVLIYAALVPGVL